MKESIETKRRIAILGSTGSIGRQTVDVIRMHPDIFQAEVLVAGHNVDALAAQARELMPDCVVIADDSKREQLANALADLPIKVYSGASAIDDVVQFDTVDVVVAAMVGFSGFSPTLKALEAGKVVALANKETLVVAGELIMRTAAEHNTAILPVDSEHSAIFQCLNGERHLSPRNVILTASGGPFRGMNREQLMAVTVAQALNHPNWSMGAKVTVDSASMMNKGLEAIEAHWLFNVNADHIKVLIHPQSIVHSMVEFADGSVKAQLAVPDMRLPIQYALTYPIRIPSPVDELDFSKFSTLTFEQPDTTVFRNLAIAFDAMRKGGTAPCAMNGANEVAVREFLAGNISFLQMSDVVENVLSQCSWVQSPTFDDFYASDAEARRMAENCVAKKTTARVG